MISCPPVAAASALVVRSQPGVSEYWIPGGGTVPRTGHHVASALSPPIRMTGDWPGASPRSSPTSTGSTAVGSRPV
jgi:hypothetical protein